MILLVMMYDIDDYDDYDDDDDSIFTSKWYCGSRTSIKVLFDDDSDDNYDDMFQ